MGERLVAVNGAADGVALTQPNSGYISLVVGSGGTRRWASAFGKFGDTGIESITPAGVSSTLRFALDAPNKAMALTAWYKTMEVLPASGGYTAFMARYGTTSAPTGKMFSILEGSSGTLYLEPLTGAAQTILPAGTLTRGQWIAIQLEALVADTPTTTNGHIQIKIFNEAGTQLGTTLVRDNIDLSTNPFGSFALNDGSFASRTGWYGVKFRDGAGPLLAPYQPSAALPDPVITLVSYTIPTSIGGTNGQAVISWTAVAGAHHYEVAIEEGTVSDLFSPSNTNATSPHTFTGLGAGPYTAAVRAKASA